MHLSSSVPPRIGLSICRRQSFFSSVKCFISFNYCHSSISSLYLRLEFIVLHLERAWAYFPTSFNICEIEMPLKMNVSYNQAAMVANAANIKSTIEAPFLSTLLICFAPWLGHLFTCLLTRAQARCQAVLSGGTR